MASKKWPMWRDRLSLDSVIFEGGIRVSGVLKSGVANCPLISYVTVVKNGAKTIERAIKSVQEQHYGNVEHVIFDGMSYDGTIDIVSKYLNKVDYFVIQKDLGLYDAMNKAIELARGDIICILNSDDWLLPDASLIAKSVIEDPVSPCLLASSALVHGEYGSVGTWRPKKVNYGSYFIGADLCHNAIYATRSAYVVSGKYDDNYNIAADRKWILKCFDLKVKFLYADSITINYTLGGLSSDEKLHCQEHMRILNDRFPYLNKSDLQNLFWIFFKYRDIASSGALCSQPSSYMESLSLLYYRYGNDYDFTRCLVQASMETLCHPFERRFFSYYATFMFENLYFKIKKNMKTILYKLSPRLYNFIKFVFKQYR